MKLVLFVLLFAFAGAPCVEGRLDETMSEVKRRYGRPLEIAGPEEARIDHCTFHWESYVVAVILREGRSVSEEFARRDRRDFTLAEVQVILALNSSPGAAWEQVNATTWKQRDRVAMWSQRTVRVESTGAR